jgi:hypothetical protein
MTEPEEILEKQMLDLLIDMPVPVIGALTPFPEGEEKTAPDSHVSIVVDIGEEVADCSPSLLTLSVTASVRVAYADDATGTLFRDVCRAFRATFTNWLGDGCSNLSTEDLICDGFLFQSTSTAPDSNDEGGGIIKTYTFTAHVRALRN